MTKEVSKNRLLKSAQADLRILDVVLRDLRCTIPADSHPLFPESSEMELQVQFNPIGHRTIEAAASHDESKKIRTVEYTVMAAARFVDPAKARSNPPEELGLDSVFGEVAAKFSAVYAFWECSDEALREFGLRNTGFHVWPYWRELLQSILSRMRLPQVALGMYQHGSIVKTATVDSLLAEASDQKAPAAGHKERGRRDGSRKGVRVPNEEVVRSKQKKR